MKTIFTSAIAILVIGFVTLANGQEQQSLFPQVSATWRPGGSPAVTELARVVSSRQASDVAIAIDELKKAESDSDREDAETKLGDALGKEYDQKLDAYAEYLDELEAKLEAMRSKLEKRRDAKAEMVRLRVEVIKAESNDLGWPGSSSNTRWNPFGHSNSVSRQTTQGIFDRSQNPFAETRHSEAARVEEGSRFFLRGRKSGQNQNSRNESSK